MKFAFSLMAVIAVALLIPFLIPGAGKQDGVDPNVNLPWQITVDAQGNSQVFGIQPGVSTLNQVREQLGSDAEVAIVAAPNEVGTLEAYYSQIPLGFVLAKVIFTVDASPGAISAMRDRALKAEYMESTTRKIRLHPDDLILAGRMPVRAVSVIPTVNLDEATVVQRFGEPGERLKVSEKRVHLLYPAKGLDVIVDQEGKELLQYVAPSHFSVLRDPLLAEVEQNAGGK